MAEAIVEAVKVCYSDRVKPYGRILRKLVCSGSGQSLELLRQQCEACAHVVVEGERGGEWSALLLGQTPEFVDCYSPEDPYGEHIWLSLSEFVDSLDDEAELPGGRYDCAQVLRKRLSCLSDLSLGEVCHIVELAIKQRRLLGYKVGGGSQPAIVAYKHSEKKVRDDQACRSQPSTKVSVAGNATWETLPGQLKVVLAQNHPDPVSLSNVKRLFLTHTGVHLDQTALGVSTLSDLLADARLRGVCEVKLTGTGYLVLPAQEHLYPQLLTVPDPDGEVLAGFPGPTSQASQRDRFASWSEGPLQNGDFVQNTFIQLPVSPSAARRWKSLPKSVGSARDPKESALQALCCKPPAIALH